VQDRLPIYIISFLDMSYCDSTRVNLRTLLIARSFQSKLKRNRPYVPWTVKLSIFLDCFRYLIVITYCKSAITKQRI